MKVCVRFADYADDFAAEKRRVAFATFVVCALASLSMQSTSVQDDSLVCSARRDEILG
jgi:hypothetical protein